MNLDEQLEAAYQIRDLRIREIEIMRIENSMKKQNQTSHGAATEQAQSGPTPKKETKK